MTHEEKLSAVKAKIVEAVPEIMELREGCRLVNKGDAWHEHAVITMHGCMFNGTTRKKEKYDERVWKILGRPITLEDVLQTALIADPANRTKLTVESSGQFFNTVTRQLGPYWTLGKPLDEQSSECIAFLYSLFYDPRIYRPIHRMVQKVEGGWLAAA